ncbi:unnamed protein product [Brassica oleracea var. botrytis]
MKLSFSLQLFSVSFMVMNIFCGHLGRCVFLLQSIN